MMYQIFGDAPTIKIIDWMLENQEYDHSMKEISGGTKLSMVVIKRDFKPLLQHAVIKVSRQIGRDAMYVLDVRSRCTKAIIEFDRQITKCCEDDIDVDKKLDTETQNTENAIDEEGYGDEHVLSEPPEPPEPPEY